MAHSWRSTILSDEKQVFDVLQELQGKRWLSRGQEKLYNQLVPSIDRDKLRGLSRSDKLELERESINLFRSAARYFAPGEEAAVIDDIIALMVMRHYGVHTRLLDWSSSPYIAAYFAAWKHENSDDGELWCFDEPLYEKEGAKQWAKWPETTIGGEGPPAKFDAKLTMFLQDEPPHWFVCQFYPSGFPRQNSQHGAFSMTPDFGRDHAEAIQTLLVNESHFHRYVIKAKLKAQLLIALRQRHGIWRGSLFPDSAGAAMTALEAFTK